MFISEDNPHLTSRFCGVLLGLTTISKMKWIYVPIHFFFFLFFYHAIIIIILIFIIVVVVVVVRSASKDSWFKPIEGRFKCNKAGI